MRFFVLLALLDKVEILIVNDAGRIAKAGTQVIIPYRDEDDKRHLKVTGDLGQIVSMVRTILRSTAFSTKKEPCR